MKNNIRSLALLLAAPFALFIGCGPGGLVEDVKNCVQICSNYEECEDADFSETTCTATCEDKADFDEAFRNAADACENCLDGDVSCAESADKCAAECDPVISQLS